MFNKGLIVHNKKGNCVYKINHGDWTVGIGGFICEHKDFNAHWIVSCYLMQGGDIMNTFDLEDGV